MWNISNIRVAGTRELDLVLLWQEQ